MGLETLDCEHRMYTIAIAETRRLRPFAEPGDKTKNCSYRCTAKLSSYVNICSVFLNATVKKNMEGFLRHACTFKTAVPGA